MPTVPCAEEEMVQLMVTDPVQLGQELVASRKANVVMVSWDEENPQDFFSLFLLLPVIRAEVGDGVRWKVSVRNWEELWSMEDVGYD